MPLKTPVYQPRKKANPFIAVLLFLMAIILVIFTVPIGFVYGIGHTLFTRGFRGLGEYVLKIAISLDQLGNVLMQYLLNVLWIKKRGYLFGNRDETISSAVGRNKQLNTLTGFGRVIDKILDTIDPNHSLNSIDYYIEPTHQIIDKLVWIHIADGKILCVKYKGKEHYTIPGGKRENKESDVKALYGGIKKKLSIELDISSLRFITVFEAQADRHEAGVIVRMICYSAGYKGKLKSSTDIEELNWLNYSEREKVSAIDMLIFDVLKDEGMLS